MRRTVLSITLVFMVGLATVGQAPAGPSPTDGDPIGTDSSVGQIYLTLPFLLGEVDLSALGVSDAELVSVGPTVTRCQHRLPP